MNQKIHSLTAPGPKLIPASATSKPSLDGQNQETQAPQLCDTTVPYTAQQFQVPHAFAPQDLLALLKNLEAEISVCQASLRDENEKRKKYKVCGTHYDLSSPYLVEACLFTNGNVIHRLMIAGEFITMMNLSVHFYQCWLSRVNLLALYNSISFTVTRKLCHQGKQHFNEAFLLSRSSSRFSLMSLLFQSHEKV